LYAGLNGYLSDIEVNKITDFVEGFQEYLKNNKTEFKQGVSETKALGETEEKALKEAITEYKKTFMATA
jgi:F-type H+-transporting ATPase subunit alpha